MANNSETRPVMLTEEERKLICDVLRAAGKDAGSAGSWLYLQKPVEGAKLMKMQWAANALADKIEEVANV